MALSLKETARHCLGLDGTFSVRNDVFGYIWGPMPRSLSLKSQLTLTKGRAINLSLILVGHKPDFMGWFTQEDTLRIQEAVHGMRQLFAQVDLGVRKLYWQYITPDLVLNFGSVDNDAATQLTEQWSGDNDGIDVFWVLDVTDAGGWSNSDGPCDKDACKERTGVVIQQGSGGRLLAHEVGHYLYLTHGSDPSNLAGADPDGDNIAQIIGNELTHAQGELMKTSCFVKARC